MRLYSSDRLASFAGYALKPAIQDAMLFLLPTFALMSSRIVTAFLSSWEIWSPNSTKTEFYPGVKDKEAELGLKLPLGSRRYDGHLGRFDPTISPQHYDASRPWLGFVLAESDDSRPEYVPFLRIWRPVRGGSDGRLDEGHLRRLEERSAHLCSRMDSWEEMAESHPEHWRNRPSGPKSKHLRDLRGLLSYENAIDRYAYAQRGMKLMAAWCRFANAVLGDEESSVAPLREVPAADELLIGVWLNGVEEMLGLWLLRHRVPCYIIHEIGSDESNVRIMGHKAKYSNFVDDTRSARIVGDCGEIDRVAFSSGHTLSKPQTDLGIPDSNLVERFMHSDRLRSSPVAQGWVEGKYKDPRAPVRLESLTLHPPPVVMVQRGLTWSTWTEESDSTGNTYFLRRGKGYRDDSDYVTYYDRIHARKLHMEGTIPTPPGYTANTSVYGQPAPRVGYFERINGKDLVPREPSTWMYSSERPSPRDEGRVYEPLEPSNLNSEVMGWPEAIYSDEEEPMDVRSRSPSPQRFQWENAGTNDRLEFRDIEDSMDVDHDNESNLDNRPSKGPQLSPRRASLNATRREGYYSQEGRDRIRGRWDILPRIPAGSSNRSPRRNSRGNDQRYLGDSDNRRRRSSRSCSPSRHLILKRGGPRSRSPISPPRPPRSPSRSRLRCASRSPTRSPYRPRSRFSSRPDSEFRSRSRSFSRSRSRSRSALLKRPRSPESPRGRINLALPAAASNISLPTQALVPRSLLERIDDRSSNEREVVNEAMEDVRSVVRYDPALAASKTGTQAVPSASSSRLQEIFPTPSTSAVPVLSTINRSNTTRFLIIWNLPVYNTWKQVVDWVQEVLTLMPGVRVRRLLRTNEAGQQVFWLVFNRTRQAATFRGLIENRHMENGPTLRCDFVSSDDYSAASGGTINSWDPDTGYTNGLTDSSALTTREFTRATPRSLAQRLGITLDTELPRRAKRGRRGPKQDSADGGAL